MIVIENLYKSFGNNTVLNDINLNIEKGSIYGIIGYSGAGKSTLIRTLNALEKPSSGKILIDNIDLYSLSEKSLRAQQKKIGMIFQHFYLLESKTVYDNIAVVLKLNGENKKNIETKI